MTAKDQFVTAYQRTVAVFGEPAEPTDGAECWRAVSDIAAEVFDDTASRLIASLKWRPKPAEWRETAKALDGERAMTKFAEFAKQADHYRAEKTFHCPLCQDTGWEPGLCTAADWCHRCLDRRYRIQPGPAYTHTFVRVCLCRATNPSYQAKHVANAQTQQGKGSKGRAA